jgi:hypothetical protein
LYLYTFFDPRIIVRGFFAKNPLTAFMANNAFTFNEEYNTSM